jgi:hypothetical protein
MKLGSSINVILGQGSFMHPIRIFSRAFSRSFAFSWVGIALFFADLKLSAMNKLQKEALVRLWNASGALKPWDEEKLTTLYRAAGSAVQCKLPNVDCYINVAVQNGLDLETVFSKRQIFADTATHEQILIACMALDSFVPTQSIMVTNGMQNLMFSHGALRHATWWKKLILYAPIPTLLKEFCREITIACDLKCVWTRCEPLLGADGLLKMCCESLPKLVYLKHNIWAIAGRIKNVKALESHICDELQQLPSVLLPMILHYAGALTPAEKVNLLGLLPLDDFPG